MRICRTVHEMKAACRGAALKGSLGFVPTMGALHAGHMSLVMAAHAACDAVAVSIFVNPTQFAPDEDLDRYPRTFTEDCRMLEAAGVDLLFAPDASEMYPAGATTYVDAGPLSERLDGASRPGHFRGVATIVTKLLHVVAPDRAYFGQKDAAQVAVLRRVVEDLMMDVELVVCPTIREADGLAMSSRNRFLTSGERARATVLHRALHAAESAWRSGAYDGTRLREILLEKLAGEPELRLDHVAVVDPDSLEELPDTRAGALLAVAAWNGATRLIDNVVLPRPYEGEADFDAQEVASGQGAHA